MGHDDTGAEHQAADSPLPIALATVVQVQAPTSARPGDKAWVSATGELEGWVGGGCVQPAVIKLSRAVVESGEPCLLRVSPRGRWEAVDGLTDYASGCLGEGSVLLFVEPVNTQPLLCILGDSAVARSLAEQAVNMNIDVMLQAPDADRGQLSRRVAIRTEYEPVVANYIIVATQGKRDMQAIQAALRSDCGYISMVVSEKKLAALKVKLEAEGISESQRARLTGPAGLRIGARLPQEIALSVLAQIIDHRRRGDSGSGVNTTRTEPLHSASATQLESNSAGCCGG